MLISLSLPILVLAGGLTGVPGLNWLKGLKLRRPPPPPQDTLPPAWKTPSRLALENQLLRGILPPMTGGKLGLKLSSDPRSLRVDMDPGSGTVSAVPEMGEVQLAEPTLVPLHEYSGDLTRRSFERKWIESNTEYIRNLAVAASAAATATPTTGLSFHLPSPLPRQVQSLLGPGGPALNISGSENIRLSGTSNWTNQQLGIQGRKPSLFPSLDMQQDLDIRLEGQLSDRVRVNLLQNSGVQIPLANRIAINYKGDEDDLVQELDLGNTNLSLPGTQYVSYSGKNEGLFGMKTAMRVGALDFSVLASKQEGRSERASYHGGGSTQHNTLADLDYVHGVYYFLYDPNFGELQIEDANIQVYLDDFNYTNDQANSVAGRAFVDSAAVLEVPWDIPERSVTGTFTLLNPGADQDYEVLHLYATKDVVIPVIRLTRQISGDQRLAAIYKAHRIGPNGAPLPQELLVGGQARTEGAAPDTVTRRYMKLLRAPDRTVNPGTNGFFTRDSLFATTRDLELKNFYQLPGQRIDPATFNLTIRKGVDDPPRIAITENSGPHTGESVPYLEVLGLDSYNQLNGTQVPGHDGKLDGTYLNSGSQQVFVDYISGILFFPDPRPFAPRIGDVYRTTGGESLFPFDEGVSNVLLRRDSLVGPEEANNAANARVYDKYNPLRSQDARYYLDFDFTAAQAVGEIQLGRGNILEGSEVVSINGQALVRDRDYTIDYDLGKVTMKRQPGPADQLNVDYSYAPLFQQAGRTLIGSAFSLQGREKSLGGAFMYESQGAQDIRPRLGEEPSRSLIGDLNTTFGFHPNWVTRMVDRLPGVRTTAPSDLQVQGELGASFPNPNTKNVVYIDDMDGIRDGVALSMSAERWLHTSVPSRKKNGLIVPILQDTLLGQRNTEIDWFTPISAFKESDLKPNLQDAEGAQTTHSSLALSLPRRPKNAAPDDTLWTGLTYVVDPHGLDLSRAQFIEVWVNDFHDSTARALSPNRFMKMHIDLGAVSEDQMRSPDVPPDGRIDTEDRPAVLGGAPDGQLDVTGPHPEDTGYDQKTDAEEQADVAAGTATIRDLTTASPADPEGDDYPKDFKITDPDNIKPSDWRGSNGTENNHTVNPNPDTEDLNLDNVPEFTDAAFEYTIELCDSCHTYLVTDVQRDFGRIPGLQHPPRADNGWRRYRIPIADTLRQQFGVPNLTLAQHVRVWLEGVKQTEEEGGLERPTLVLGGLEIVGNRWLVSALTDSQQVAGTTLTLNTLNTVDNADEYSAPFDPGSDRSGGQAVARREQALDMEFENLQPGDTLEVFKTFSIDEDYSRYGKLDWFVAGLKITDNYDPRTAPLEYFVRFSSDELGLNYYEYKARVPMDPTRKVGWDDIQLELTALSNLKLAPTFPKGDTILYQVPGPRGNDVLTVKGRPSFTRLRRISFGIINHQTTPGAVIHGGKLLLDELRATDIAKDAGYAERLLVTGRMANLVSYNLSWNGRDANFQSVGESRGAGYSLSQLTAGANLDVHRFFEGTGIVLPVGINYSRGSSKPRFTAGDDVIRTGALEDASETFSATKSFTTSYSRQWSDRANPLLRYTLGGITANYAFNQTDGRNPNSVTTFKGTAAAVNYGITPRDLMILRVPLTKTRLYLLPERFYWNYNVNTSEQLVYDRIENASKLALRSDVNGRTSYINFGADTRPLDFMHHHFEAVRNLTLPDEQREQFGIVNLGKVVTWRQNMDARFSLNRGPWMSPTFGWSGNYAQDNRPELSPDLSIRALANGQSLNASWALPFDRLQPVVRRAPGDTSHVAHTRPSLRGLLARLGAISTEAGYNQSSSYSRLLGTSDFLYLLGMSDNPGLKPNDSGRMRDTTGNTIGKTTDWRAAARTRLLLISDMTLAINGQYTWRRNEMNLVASRSATQGFPDVDVDYGRLPTLLQLNRLMSQPRIRTHYTRSQITEYRVRESTPSSIATSSQWQPLLQLNGDLRNQTRAEFKVERRVTVREDFNFGSSTRTDRNTDINLSLNRSYSRGQKVKFLGKESTIKSSVTLGLTGVYSRVSGETIKGGTSQAQLRVDNDRLSLNGTGSYSFSNNVTGSVALGFGQTRDVVRDAVSRNVRVELRAAFTF
jgi:hypothetical protein